MRRDAGSHDGSSTHTCRCALQILKATKAKPVHLAMTGAIMTVYTVRGIVYVELPGALVAGPFAVTRKKTVLRPGTAVRSELLGFVYIP